jgi:hypothetical protein
MCGLQSTVRICSSLPGEGTRTNGGRRPGEGGMAFEALVQAPWCMSAGSDMRLGGLKGRCLT